AITLPSCIRTQPRPSFEASQYTVNLLFWSGRVRTGAIVNLFFSSSKAIWRSSVHMKSTHFSSKEANGFAILEKFSMNLQYYPAKPKNDRISFTDCGVFHSS